MIPRGPGRKNRFFGVFHVSRALSYRDLYDLYLDTLMECVRSASEASAGAADQRGWLEREVEREYQQIRDAALSDPEKTYTNEEFEAAVSGLRGFARQRGSFVTDEVNAARQQSFPSRLIRARAGNRSDTPSRD